eukprot:UN10888
MIISPHFLQHKKYCCLFFPPFVFFLLSFYKSHTHTKKKRTNIHLPFTNSKNMFLILYFHVYNINKFHSFSFLSFFPSSSTHIYDLQFFFFILSLLTYHHPLRITKTYTNIHTIIHPYVYLQAQYI